MWFLDSLGLKTIIIFIHNLKNIGVMTEGKQSTNTVKVLDNGFDIFAASSTKVKELEKMLDMGKFLHQVEKLLQQPIKIPGISTTGSGPTANKVKHSIFSVKGVWKNDEEHKANVSKLYNTSQAGERQWLKRILIEESDSDSDGECCFTKEDIRHLLKIHKKRRRMQKAYHNDILNSQYTYYAAGLLCTEDPFPEHQKTIVKQFGYPELDDEL
ncbi:Hypothetical protein SRAE_1000283200 [Strongyloides ratti]|uniref:Uncharacterized protein n=1 Tax=Strongyloides ratti TaxID=34506 RepID=A0A090MX02_STRRB|nr:Hypothetical protein SRAE_1000283200 [Strongyloides ratti]CEF64579.1 Hypothetical protein SRAE_1000283200 [Strongyloides ratti]